MLNRRESPRDAGKVGCMKGGMQERREAGKEKGRTGEMQDRRDTGDERYKKIDSEIAQISP